MRKNLAIVLMLSLLCSLAACGGGDRGNNGSELSLISCPEQGFTTRTNPSYTWESNEVEGLYIYIEEKGSVPFVRISLFDDINSVDDACDYMAETIRPALKGSNPDGMFAATESEEKRMGGKKLPAGEYIYEEQGQQVVMQLAFDTSGDHTVVYQAKYLYDKGEETMDALDKAIRNFKAGNDPKADNANPNLLGGAGSSTGGDADSLNLISCPEQGFTTKADPSYAWRYVEGDGITIWTMQQDSVPYVLVFRTNFLRDKDESYRHFRENYTPYMREEYGDDLLSYEEYEAYEIGGKKLPAALYTYKNSQGYILEMLRIEDPTGDSTVQYTAKYQQGYGDDTLKALDTAIRNFKSTSNAEDPNLSDTVKPGPLDQAEAEFTIIPAESKTVEYELYDNGLISMEIPKGWQVTVDSPAGEYVCYEFSVSNPKDERYGLRYCRMLPALMVDSEHIALMVDSKQAAQVLNQIYGGYIAIEPATTESLIRVIYSLENSSFELLEDLGALPLPAGLSGNILHAKVTDAGGNSREGIFLASLYIYSTGFIGFGLNNPNFVDAFGFTAITAPECELINWEEPIGHCLNTLKFSEAYNQGYTNEWRQVFNTSAIIGDTYSDISDIITDGYEARQSTYDIISQKQSDATLGYERVYDTETGEIYKAYNGFTDDISTNNYYSERYQPVTDGMYMEGIDGYIEK